MSTTNGNSINYDSFFTETIKDNNGKTITDVNAGLVNLYSFFNDEAPLLSPKEGYLISEFEESFPELVAKNSYLGSQEYWWWILILNRLDDPFESIKTNYVYSINDNEAINEFITDSNITKEQQTTSKIGTIVELN